MAMSSPECFGSAKIVLLGDSGVGKSSILHRFCYPEQQFDPHGPPTVGAAFLTQLIKLDDDTNTNNNNNNTNSNIHDAGAQYTQQQHTSNIQQSHPLSNERDNRKSKRYENKSNSSSSRGERSINNNRNRNRNRNRNSNFGSPKAIKFDIWDTAGQERYRSLSKLYYHNARAAIIVYDISNRGSYEKPGAKQWIEEVLMEEGENGIKIALVGNKCDLSNEKRQVSFEEAKKYAMKYNFLFWETSAKYHTNIENLFKNIAKSIPIELLEQNGAKLNLNNYKNNNKQNQNNNGQLMSIVDDDSQFQNKQKSECCNLI